MGEGDVLPILLSYAQLRDLSACHIAGDDRPCGVRAIKCGLGQISTAKELGASSYLASY
jgi:hypothetical protein